MVNVKKIAAVSTLICSTSITFALNSFADEPGYSPETPVTHVTSNRRAPQDTYASPERAEAAKGHYARARALLMSALNEFEQARSIARPDLLFDPERWRTSVIDRAEDLDHIIEPQARVTQGGTRFPAEPSLIHEPKEPRATAPVHQKSFYRSAATAAKPAAAKPAASEPAAEVPVAAEKSELPPPSTHLKAAKPAPEAKKPAPEPVKEQKSSAAVSSESAFDQEIDRELKKAAGSSSAASSEASEAPAARAPHEETRAPEPSLAPASPGANPPSAVIPAPEPDAESSSVASGKPGKQAASDDEEIRERLKKLSQEIAEEEQKKAAPKK